MAATPFLFLIFLFNFYLEIAQAAQYTAEITEKHNLQTYIVHVSKPAGTFSQTHNLEKWHKSFLPFSMASSEKQQQRILYSYQNIISGFAARLTKEEVKAMEEIDGFVSARPERKIRLQKHTPSFLGLHQQMGFWKESNFGKGMIIGVLDGGIFPSHPSFAKAMKGVADEPPIDVDGHGTHTASTAAGSFVYNADTLGNAKGTAVGMAPYAHLAIYKVCFGGPTADCTESDILAGLDIAVQDGVDVLSLSLVDVSMPFFKTT
ncbi:hypothetical protein GH714_029158 [Hevea brasiliensis]|uniref:Inhibitor I9 domain-containing protein n=1 Tax=Hevea brasiliensis TaxID=3981 RepID=A0A6A6LFX5_HEVBR|nr:hypothetical protein GH714_029158 [Hevea brasiliensis]